MGKWDEQINAAEEDMRKEKFILDVLKRKFELDYSSAKELAEHIDLQGKFEPKEGTLKVEHDHGFILMDLEGFKALPKSQQTKILKLGGQ